MRLFKYFSRRVELKSAFQSQGLFNQGSFNIPKVVEPVKAINYYKAIAPLATAINMISDECAAIDLALQDASNGEFIYDHPINKFLFNPNPDTTYNEFLKTLTAFYTLTGNAYIQITAKSPVSEPFEMYCINPQFIKITGDIIAETYTYTSANYTVEFHRKETPKSIRYFNKDGTSELIHIKNFNPDIGSTIYTGISPLNAIWYELEQYANQSIHNLSLLNNSARPSGILVSKDALSDDSRQRLVAQLNNNNMGASNAGRPMLVDGADIGWQQTSMTNKDMDFLELRREITKMIYSALKIPLPLVSAETMTMNNYIQAQLSLYDNVVLPLMKKVGQELAKALFPRFKISPNHDLYFDERTIPALRARYNENIERLQKTGALSLNEIRILNGYEPLVSGGDEVRQPANLLSVGAVKEEPLTDLEPIPQDDIIKNYDLAIKKARNADS